MTRLMRSAVAVVVVAGAMLGGWACSDDEGDTLTLDEYFAEVERLDKAANDQADALFDNAEDSTGLEPLKALTAGIPNIINEFNAGLEGLDPPEEAQEAHDEAVAAAQAYAEAHESTLVEALSAETVEEFQAAFDDPEFIQADERLQDACSDLVQVGTDNNIEVSLTCEQEPAIEAPRSRQVS